MLPASLLPEAEADLIETIGWYEAQREGLGSEFLDALREALESIGRAPRLYPIVARRTHRARLRRFPFWILFTIEPGEILVTGLFHSRRDPLRWSDRVRDRVDPRAALVTILFVLSAIAALAGVSSAGGPQPRRYEIASDSMQPMVWLPGDSGRVDIPSDVLPDSAGAVICGWTIVGDAPAEAFVIRVDTALGLIWRRQYGGAGADILFSLRADPAGGFVAAGLTTSRGPSMDGWIVALDDTGGVRHEITHGGPGADRLTSIARSGDGWLAAGQFDVDGQVDAWVLRTDAHGNETARWLSGDSLSDGGLAAEPTSDGGCVVVGSAGASREDADGFVTRLAADFSVRWTHRFGGPGRQLAYHLVPAGGDSFLVTGYGDAGPARDMDASARLIGPEGGVLWERALGDSAVDRGVQAAWFEDGTSVVIGYSKPPGPDVDGEPIWTTKLYGLDRTGMLKWTTPIHGLGRESGRWIAANGTDVWVVAPGPGGRVLLARIELP